MTIYKFIKTEKEPEKKLIPGDVPPDEPLDEVEVAAHVTYRRQKSKLCLNIFLVFMALLVLAAGIFGGIQLYKHLQKHHLFKKWRGTCDFTIRREKVPEPKALPQNSPDKIPYGNDFLKDGRHHHRKPGHHKHHHRRPHTTGAPMSVFQKMKEEIEVINEMIEKIHPKFDDIDNTLILHDFERNYSAIVDYEMHVCYVMNLDRKQTAPPRDLIDLIRKINTGYYLPRVDVIKKKYRMVTPAIKDISYLGTYIVQECIGYRTYKLERIVGDKIEKRRRRSSKKDFIYLDRKGDKATEYEVYM